MSDTSRGRVTITLGRRGQVVKKAGPGSDVSVSNSWAVTGTKRSVRDRLGNNLDSDIYHGSQFSNKRLRGDAGVSNQSSNMLDGSELNQPALTHIRKDDLRYKLMQKDASRRAQRNNERLPDLREKLRKADQAPIPRLDSRHQAPPLHDTSILRRVPPTRSADDLPWDTLGSSYSTWTMDNLRQESPARILGSSRRLSLQRNDEPQRRPINLPLESARSLNYVPKDVHNASGSVSSASFMTNSLLSPPSTKPVAPTVGLHPPPSGAMHKTLYPVQVDELQTIDGLLHSLGLGKYAILFKAEEVDIAALKQMGENDLKELGIPMGPRKKILLAIAPRSKRQP